jgi:hypothetical protein
VLGLYEYNPVNMMPCLFEKHYDSQFYSGGSPLNLEVWIIANQIGTGRSFFAGVVLYFIGLGFTVGFCWICSVAVHQLNTKIYEDIKKEGFPTSFGQFHDISPMFMLEGMVSLCLLVNIGYSLYFLREIVSAFGRLTPFRKLAKLLRRAFLWTPKTISRQFGDFNTPTWAERALSVVTQFCQCFKTVIWFPANPTLVRFVRCFGAHILVFYGRRCRMRFCGIPFSWSFISVIP